MTKKTLFFSAFLILLLFPKGVFAQLAGGTYTINSGQPTGGTNFISFSDAVTAMSAGISGPVVVNVTTGSGPYNEQVIIPAITGASPANTVTFNGNGNTLTFAASVNTERATIKLNGADYVTVNNLVINATGATYGYGVQIINNADHNTINNCTITPSASTLGYCGVCINGNVSQSFITNSFSDSNTISNNTITGGYYGITVIGDPAAAIYGNQVTGNTLNNAYFTGIYAVGNNHLLISGNDIKRASLASLNSFYGINLGNGNLNTLVSRNKIHNFFGSLTGTSYYSIYGLGTQSVATAGNENIFANNLVYNMDGDGTQYGMYNTGGSYTLYYFNTVSSDNTGSAGGITYGFYQTNAASGIVFKNNLISVTRGGTGNRYGIYMNTAATTFTANNNDYYINSAGTNYTGRSGTTNYSTLSAWQTASSQDAASVSSTPLFSNPSTGNFLPSSSLLDNLGVPITGINTDITGAARSTATPDLGAYEFTAPVIAITGSNQLCTGTTATLTGAPAGGSWSSSNTSVATISSTGVVTAVAAGTSIVTYTTTTGYKNDTVTVTATPVVDTITAPSSLCVGAAAALTNTTAGGTWTSSNQFMATINTSGLLTVVGPGSLTVTYTVMNGSCSATATKSITLNAKPSAAVTVIGSTSGCTGSIITLVAGNNYTYQWLQNNTALSGATSSTYTASAAGDYRVVLTTSNGCTDTSAPVNFIINPLPPASISATGPTSFCNGDSVILQAGSGNYLYQWKKNGVTIAGATSPVYTAYNSGNYTVIQTDGLGCSGTSAVVNISNNSPAGVLTASGPVNFCLGGSVTLKTDTGTGYTYQWFRNGTAIAAAIGNTYTTTVAGVYHAVVNSSSCSTTTADSIVVVNQPPVPVITLSGGTYSTTVTYATYQWQYNGINIGGATSQAYTPPPQQQGTYSVIVKDVNGCMGSATYAGVGVPVVNGSGTTVHVYPNPATSQVFIEAPPETTAIVYSMDGRELLRTATNSVTELGSLPAAVYQLRIYDKNHVLMAVGKLIKN